MRPTLYLLVSMLFDEPSPPRLAAARSLLDRLPESTPDSLTAPLARLAIPLDGAAELAQEYTRLFVLGNPGVAAQPFGAYWLERRLMGESTREFARQMEAWGVATDPDSGLLPDHIVAEFEFLAWLAEQERPDARASRSALLHTHIARWVPHFTAALRAAVPPADPFYIAAADFLDALLAWESGHDERATAEPISRFQGVLNEA